MELLRMLFSFDLPLLIYLIIYVWSLHLCNFFQLWMPIDQTYYIIYEQMAAEDVPPTIPVEKDKEDKDEKYYHKWTEAEDRALLEAMREIGRAHV